MQTCLQLLKTSVIAKLLVFCKYKLYNTPDKIMAYTRVSELRYIK